MGEKKKHYKLTFFRIMVPTQELVKARQSLRQVIFNLHHTSMWECIDSHIAFIPPRSIFQTMAISLEINSKGLVFKLKKLKRKKNNGLLFTSPIKHDTFQAIVGQQRPRTKKRDACKLSCCFANLNLLLLTVSFVAIVFA